MKNLNAETLTRALQLFALSTAAGVPVGIVATNLKNKIAPDDHKIPSPSTYAELPLIAKAGPEREKVSGTLSDVYKFVRHPRTSYYNVAAQSKRLLGDAQKPLAAAGASLGAATGVGAAQLQEDREQEEDLDKQLAAREEAFNKLLLEEQSAAAGTKIAAVLDEALDTVLADTIKKEAGSEKSLDFMAHLLAILGVGAGAAAGYVHEQSENPNIRQAQALESSLSQRLGGNPEGPRAPMIIKVKTDRVGATPIAGGATSAGRDVLSRL